MARPYRVEAAREQKPPGNGGGAGRKKRNGAVLTPLLVIMTIALALLQGSSDTRSLRAPLAANQFSGG